MNGSELMCVGSDSSEYATYVVSVWCEGRAVGKGVYD